MYGRWGRKTVYTLLVEAQRLNVILYFFFVLFLGGGVTLPSRRTRSSSNVGSQNVLERTVNIAPPPNKKKKKTPTHSNTSSTRVYSRRWMPFHPETSSSCAGIYARICLNVGLCLNRRFYLFIIVVFPRLFRPFCVLPNICLARAKHTQFVVNTFSVEERFGIHHNRIDVRCLRGWSILSGYFTWEKAHPPMSKLHKLRIYALKVYICYIEQLSHWMLYSIAVWNASQAFYRLFAVQCSCILCFCMLFYYLKHNSSKFLVYIL